MPYALGVTARRGLAIVGRIIEAHGGTLETRLLKLSGLRISF